MRVDDVSVVEENRILVVGTGPAGLVAALALSHCGKKVALVGPAPAHSDKRTTALMRPAIEFLERLGVGDQVRQIAAPLSVMRIVDGTARLIRSPAVTFRASEIDEEFFGLNIPNAALNQTLGEAVRADGNIAWHETVVTAWKTAPDRVEVTLEDSTVLASQLAVAADGRNSLAREAAGISVRTKNLQQSAMVLNFAHARHHGFASTEFHTEHGPCTQVPLPGGFRSSLVWVMRPQDAETLSALDDETLSRRIEARHQSFLGKVTVEPGRQVYPLASIQPSRFAARRIALVGEAAHVFPPITAQGLNLGIRDVMDLTDVVTAQPVDPGAESVLAAYDARRRPDIMARSGAVNLVNASLLSSFLPMQLARSAGLTMLEAIPPLRAFFMREGMYPGSGFSALFPSRLRRVVSSTTNAG